MSGLTNNQQAILMIVSLALIGFGGITAAAQQSYGLPPITGFVFLVLGIIGAAIKEVLGVSSPSTVPPTSKS